jgi:hypothetical protein
MATWQKHFDKVSTEAVKQNSEPEMPTPEEAKAIEMKLNDPAHGILQELSDIQWCYGGWALPRILDEVGRSNGHASPRAISTAIAFRTSHRYECGTPWMSSGMTSHSASR